MPLKKNIKYVMFALFCAMPLLLAVSRAGADIAICTIGAVFLLRSALTHDFSWFQRPELRALAALWASLLIGSLFAADMESSLLSALIWGRFIVFYAAVTAWLLTTPKSLHVAAGVALPILLLLVIDTGWQYVTGMSLSGHPVLGDRLVGPMKHPNIGNLLFKTMIPTLGIAIYMVREQRWKYLPLAAFTLALMAVVLVSGERSSAMLMLLASGVIGGICFIGWRASRPWVVTSGVMIAALVIALAATQSVVQHRGKFLADQLADFWNTPYGQLYQAAFRLWERHPIFGIGANQFRDICAPMMTELNVNYCDLHPHNMYLEWLVDGGLIGLALFVLAMVLIKWRVWRISSFSGRDTAPSAFAFGAFAALLFPIIVTQSMFANWSGVMFWYALAFAASLPKLVVKNE